MISTAFVNCDAETVYSSDSGYMIVKECNEIEGNAVRNELQIHFCIFLFKRKKRG